MIVRDGQVVSEGWHERAGGAHAEIVAIESAGSAARNATVYVTLEPCSHHGRTGPCADVLVGAGVGRVVVAMQDPNPQVSGAGISRLRQAGISVDCGVMEAQARQLNIGYVSRMTRGRPWVRVKIAAGLDGKTSLENGVSQWITGPDARRDVHRWRARSCAVVTGIGTLTSDDPQLTVRNVETSRQPLRVVVDSRLRIPLHSRIFEGGGLLIATANEDEPRIRQINDLGAEVVVLPDQEGKVDLGRFMALLGERSINEVLVEAGINLHSALWKAGTIDELLIYYAPKMLGSRGRGMFDLGDLGDMEGAPVFEIEDLRQFGPDLRVLARVKS